MGLQINTNVGALNAYRNLSGTQNAMSTSLERLSSGLRINRAADDAAGLAISEKLRSQISGLQKASSNAQDGISLIQTGEGALNESHSILQRMRELSVQAANDTNTDTDRKQIQKEVDQLSQELTRIGNSTQFNGKNLLNGDLTSTPLKLQIGANSGQSMSVSIGDMRGYALGVTGQGESKISSSTQGNIAGNAAVATDMTGAGGNLVVKVDGGSAQTIALAATDNRAQALAKIQAGLTGATASLDASNKLVITSNSVGASSGVTVDSTSTDTTIEALGLQTAAVTTTTAGKSTGTVTALTAGTVLATAGGFDVKVDANAAKTIAIAVNDTVQMVLDKINTAIGATGTASLDASGSLQVVSASSGTSSKVLFSAVTGTDHFGLTAPVAADGTSTTTPKAANTTATTGTTGTVVTSTAAVTNGGAAGFGLDAGSYTITAVAAGTTAGLADVLDSSGQRVATYNATTGDIKDLTSAANTLANVASGSRSNQAWNLEIHGVNVSTQTAASLTVSTMDSAISKVSDQRSTLGSVQNRLQHTINNLGVAAENLTASESRIRDTDMAKEMTSFTRAQILSQAGISMLAQANQAPQSVLKLLG
jgi:flagellin